LCILLPPRTFKTLVGGVKVRGSGGTKVHNHGKEFLFFVCLSCFDYSKFYHLRNKDEECLNFSLVIMNTMAILAEVISGGKTFLTFSLCAAGTEF